MYWKSVLRDRKAAKGLEVADLVQRPLRSALCLLDSEFLASL